MTNIEFLGAKWGDELEDILYNAKYVVVPSVWYENFPYVILQSFAAGVPVIGSNRGGIPELLNNERGLLFNPEDISSLEMAINTLNEDQILSKNIELNGRKYLIENFNDQKFYKSIMNNYKIVLE